MLTRRLLLGAAAMVPFAARERQHMVGQAIAVLARDPRGIAQLDQRLEQPHQGRAGQVGLGGQH